MSCNLPSPTCSRGAGSRVFIVLLGILIVSSWTLAGCGSAAPVEDVEPTFELPADWHHSTAGVEDFDPGWCADFGEPSLEALIENVLEQNLDLRIAESRIQQARALLRQSRASRHPRVGIGAHTEGELGPDGWEQEYEISAPVSYEVDLWGRIRSQISAAEFDLEAAELDLRTFELALASETAENYFELARVRSELRLLDNQLENAETFLELTHIRHRQGMANAIDVVQQQQQIEELREARLRAELDETLVLSAIAALLGQPQGDLEVASADELPEVLPVVADFLPADLLTRRPDVRGAHLRVTAADQRIEAALAERLPRLQLSASLALQAMNIQQLFEFLFVTVAGSLTQPLWEGGRIQGRIEEEEAIKERQLLEYSATLLEAIREVEDSLARGQALHEISKTQRLQLESAREALSLAREQYRAGILDYLRVLTALQSVQSLELAELDSKRILLSQRIQLCRASGGYWPEPTSDENQP